MVASPRPNGKISLKLSLGVVNACEINADGGDGVPGTA
jgi:hypothetical protein